MSITTTGRIDANRLEQMAKERPGECFLKGSGVLKLISGIRQLEAEVRAHHDRGAELQAALDKLERVSKWINKFPIPTKGATAMMILLREVQVAIMCLPTPARTHRADFTTSIPMADNFSLHALDSTQELKAVRDAAIDDLMATSDEDLRKEIAEDGQDINAVAAKVKEGLLDTCMSSHGPEGCYRVRCQLGKKCVADAQQSKEGAE